MTNEMNMIVHYLTGILQVHKVHVQITYRITYCHYDIITLYMYSNSKCAINVYMYMHMHMYMYVHSAVQLLLYVQVYTHVSTAIKAYYIFKDSSKQLLSLR